MRRSLLLASLMLAASTVAARSQEAVTTYRSDTSFSDVVADMEDAIVNRGFVVDYHGFIGDMLKRTAADIEGATRLYRDAELFQFCSAVMSRNAMEADTGNIAFCPYVLFVYETEKDTGTVTVGFRRLPDGPGRDEINNLLDEIAREASGQF